MHIAVHYVSAACLLPARGEPGGRSAAPPTRGSGHKLKRLTLFQKSSE